MENKFIKGYKLFLEAKEYKTKVILSKKFIKRLYIIFMETDVKEVIDMLVALDNTEISSKREKLMIDYIEFEKLLIINNSIKIKIGKLLKELLPNLNDQEIEKVVNIWNVSQEIDLDKENLKIVDGWDFEKYFNKNNFENSDGKSVLYNSCMNNKFSSIYDFYRKNDNIKLLVKVNENDELVARALLFYATDSNVYMDNVYYNNEKYKYIFYKYAQKNDIKIFKVHKQIEDTTIESEVEYKASVKLDYIEFDNYPYLDHFHSLNINTRELSTYTKGSASDTIIELRELKNNKWKFIQGNPNWDITIHDWETEIDDDFEFIKSIVGTNTMLEYGILFDNQKRDYLIGQYDMYYNDIESYIDNIIELLDDNDKIELAHNVYDYEYVLSELDGDELEEILKNYEESFNTKEEMLNFLIGESNINKKKLLASIFENVYDIDDLDDIISDNIDEIKNDYIDLMVEKLIEKEGNEINNIDDLLREMYIEDIDTWLYNNFLFNVFIENAQKDGFDLTVLLEEEED